MRDEAERRIGHLYPKAKLADGTKANVIAWIWARTVTCPNPACGIEMPLVRSWWLGKKKGKEAYIVPRVADGRVEFAIGHDVAAPGTRTKRSHDGFDKSMAKCHTFAMPGRVYEALFEVALEQYGYITAKDTRELGFEPSHLVDLARRGDLDRVAHGLYRFKVVPVTMRDQLMEAALWPRGLGVISHATALDLWNLCDVNPAKIHVTVPKSARIRRKALPAYEVHIRDLDATDITRSEGIAVVTVRRAILDGIEAQIGGHLIDQAVDTAIRQGLLSAAEQVEITATRANRVGAP
jgi:hypothetical protein